ncbi:hypothetical protein SAMN05216548_108160 [Faunimonas pinastri]|uniref:DUF2155 domain-containing protein n=1 Tax=Faunimonas pinastri TaxID=1855383 RepID=A0A1H9JKK2_9HYPH|nr:DUF2155 domain-containing protein [Faunimonas pinastri]SEQ87329.1 hypothetical protein SAMN05216548_108160 [Faunimonas pinastri]
MRNLLPATGVLLTLLAASPASAEPIKNPVAVFEGLDKITARVTKFDVRIDETVQFGALRVTPKVCHTRPPTEPAQTTAFVDVDEVTLEGKVQRIFTGWMFAASPGLHAVEHPVYDVWLVDCKQQMSKESTDNPNAQEQMEAPPVGTDTTPQAAPEAGAPED